MDQESVRLKTTQSNQYPGVRHVDVQETVKNLKELLGKKNKVVLIAKQNEISRVALVIKKVQEQCKCEVKKMQAYNQEEKLEEDKKRSILCFRTIFEVKQ